MAFTKVIHKTVGQVQLDKFNKSNAMICGEYPLPAGTDWAVCGFVMTDAFDPDAHETLLVNALEALAEVGQIGASRLYGVADAEIAANDEGGTYEFVLHVASKMTMTVGSGGDTRDRTESEHEYAKPPLGKQWIVLTFSVPAPLDAAGITALEAACEGVEIGGQNPITKCEHLIDGTVRDDAVGANLVVTSQLKIDAVPVEE